MRELSGFSVLKKAFALSLRIKSRLTLVVSILGFGFAFFPTIIAKQLQVLTDTIQGLVSKQTSYADAITVLLVLIVLFILYTAFQSIQACCLKLDSDRTQLYLKEYLLKLKCNVKYRFIENDENFQERIVFVESGNGSLQAAGSIQNIIYLLQQLVTFCSIVVTLLDVSAWIVFCILLTCIPAIILAQKQKDETFRSRIKWMEEGALVLHYFFLCCGEDSAQEVRFNQLYNYLKSRWQGVAKSYCDKKNRLIAKHVKYNVIADSLRNIVYIFVLSFSAWQIYCDPALGLGLFSLVFTLTSKLQNATTELFVGIMQFIGDIPFMKEFFGLDQLEKEENACIEPLDIQTIEFNNVTFSYPNSSQQALKSLNVTIHAGEKIAIVGENGSGKTTFVNLLCGMFRPQEGQILINGHDVNEKLPELRASISAVFQDFGKYETTLRENITVSQPARDASDDEIIQLATDLNFSEIIDQITLNAKIGVTSKISKTLSGGQWQKVALLRAAYKQDARLMILDEPTAALDPIAEAQLYQNFTNITGNRTTLLISHRLGISSVVDRILVFRNGTIIESGTHQELMHLNGYYAELYHAQAQWYV